MESTIINNRIEKKNPPTTTYGEQLSLKSQLKDKNRLHNQRSHLERCGVPDTQNQTVL